MNGSHRGVAAAPPLVGPAVAPDLHIMSFNARLDTQAAPGTPDHWPLRRSAIRALLRSERPTILGTQELLNHQLVAVAESLPVSYDVLGGGRLDGLTAGEYAAIFYDRNRLTPLSYRQSWLSDTPAIPGSCTWGNRHPRIVVTALMRDRLTGRDLLVANTHLDHESDWARLRSVRPLLELARQMPEPTPVVLMGDFNSPAGRSPEYAQLVEHGPYRDTWTAARRRLTPEHGTFPGYGTPDTRTPRIDWILVTPEFEVSAAAVNTFTLDGIWPSDHAPVQARLRLR